MKKYSGRISRKDRKELSNAIETALMRDFFKRLPKLVAERKQAAIKALKGLSILVLCLGFMGCNTNPLPMCPSTVISETCVDHQDVAICMVDSAPITGCIVPSGGIDQGVECVKTCPPNRYDTTCAWPDGTPIVRPAGDGTLDTGIATVTCAGATCKGAKADTAVSCTAGVCSYTEGP